ncbi:MAG: hypothetical protein R3E09_15875 [Novosphingobium sp.]
MAFIVAAMAATVDWRAICAQDGARMQSGFPNASIIKKHGTGRL